MGKIAVVIPNYNGIKYIEECLNSLMRMGNIPEIIVVDNNSQDGSREIIDQRFKKVKLIPFSENKGFSVAVNAGILAAQSEYVFLLNNDTTVEPDTLSALEQVLDENPNIFSVAARMLQMSAPDRLDGAGDLYCALGWAFARGKDKPADKYNKLCRIFSACAGAAMYRKELFDKIGLFDEMHFAYLEDLDLGYRANISGYQNVYAPETAVLHAGSAVSGSRHNKFKVNLASRNSIYVIYKNMPFLQFVVNLPFLCVGYFIKTMFFTLKGMGGTYLKGLVEGVRMSFSKEGRQKKVKFMWKNVGHYLWIQWQLWINMLRFL